MTGPAPAARFGRADAIQAAFARKWRFEVAHMDVTVIVPAGLNDRWRAVVPADRAPEGSDGTLGADDLAALMDQLEEIYPAGGGA